MSPELPLAQNVIWNLRTSRSFIALVAAGDLVEGAGAVEDTARLDSPIQYVG
jgi:hypothetical protein